MAKKLLVTVVVLMAFQDKFDHKTQYAPGMELQVEKERADDLASRGLAKIKEETPTKEPKQPKGAKPAANPEPAENVGREVTAENAVLPAGDNPEKKQEDEPGTEEQ